MKHPKTDFSLQLPQQKFGRYQVIKLLGEGAMGRVYLAEDPLLDRLVALKVIALDRTVDAETSHEFFERFNLEARASARLNHPSIVTIHDAGNDSGIPWIAFEFVKGNHLDSMIQNESRFSFKKVRTISTQLASALNYAHEMHIIHRDIKPQNILIDERTHIAKLADFGIAKAPWAGLTREGNSVGSPGYMSPEQIEGIETDNRSDLFSLGIVIYEMITGTSPFIKESIHATFYATLNVVYTPVTNLRPDTPDDLKTIIGGLLRADPAKRIQSAVDILSLIDNKAKTVSGSSTAYVPTKTYHSIQLPRQLRHIIDMLVHCGVQIIPNHHVWKLWYTIANYISRSVTVMTRVGRRLLSESTDRLKMYLPALATLYSSHKTTILKGVAVILPLCLIAMFLKPFCNHKKSVPISKKGTTILNEMKENVDSFFSDKQFDNIRKTTDDFIEQYGSNNDVKWIQARLALKNANYSESLTLMREIADNNGNRIFSEDKSMLLDEIQAIFRNGKAPEEVVLICSQPLRPIFTPVINDWLNNTHYWIRWNTVSVCNFINRKVDMVNIYILDLQTAASMRTRIRAAEKLGELGDSRAITPLEEISKRGFRDPFVSRAATNVLEQYFRK